MRRTGAGDDEKKTANELVGRGTNSPKHKKELFTARKNIPSNSSSCTPGPKRTSSAGRAPPLPPW